MSQDDKQRHKLSHFKDLARSAFGPKSAVRARYTRFLEEPDVVLCKRAAREEGVSLCFGAGRERQMAAFYQGDAPENYPVCCLRATWHAKDKAPSHRDFLGAIMALGITRDGVGDIVLGDGFALIMVIASLEETLRAMESAGRTPIAWHKSQWPEDVPEDDGQELRVVVASLRLDAVLAAGFGLSRTRAQELIAQGNVKVGHLPWAPEKKVLQGALISLRGMGRIVVTTIGQENKKGKRPLILRRFT